jgi:hypothetical protein
MSNILPFYYANNIADFLVESPDSIIGKLSAKSDHDIVLTQRDAWNKEIQVMQQVLLAYKDRGSVYFEYNIPRMGRRIDIVVLIDGVVFVLEFKAFQEDIISADIIQVWDYALDLKNFHEESHNRPIIPILVTTETSKIMEEFIEYDDLVFKPLATSTEHLQSLIADGLKHVAPLGNFNDDQAWATSRYAPTPTIIEAATALYNSHSVADISRSDATAANLTTTSTRICEIIDQCRKEQRKAICFVTGVPGAGKTLVGLNMAIYQFEHKENAVYLSGNFPLVAVLTEALARDLKKRSDKSKKEATSEVKTFIQMIHHYRDACLEGARIVNGAIVADENYYRSSENMDKSHAPIEHVAIFDEAQRAWTKEQLAYFMKRKKGVPDFPYSEPKYLISCLDRHQDWAVIICLVGGGQEINTGEAGIQEWLNALNKDYPDWEVYMSDRLKDDEYAQGRALQMVNIQKRHPEPSLHLAVSLRSFRAENLSSFVHYLLNLEENKASDQLTQLKNYPIVLTRSIDTAKQWLKHHTRGSERCGLLASSTADRLKPISLNVRYAPNEVHWFLDNDNDVRSSNYLEDVATEFQVQGLEVDWSCVTWDADMRYTPQGWRHYKFNGGTAWLNMQKPQNQQYQLNAYRVLLTRARQGMVIVVPSGCTTDSTRNPEYYDATYEYLKRVGIKEILA